MNSLTVLYDSNCSLCDWATVWLQSHPQSVPLSFVAADSVEAHELFPDIDHERTLEDITVIGDDGSIYENERAWIVCLWALPKYRNLARRLSDPLMLASTKRIVAAVSRYRPRADDTCSNDNCRV